MLLENLYFVLYQLYKIQKKNFFQNEIEKITYTISCIDPSRINIAISMKMIKIRERKLTLASFAISRYKQRGKVRKKVDKAMTTSRRAINESGLAFVIRTITRVTVSPTTTLYDTIAGKRDKRYFSLYRQEEKE